MSPHEQLKSLIQALITNGTLTEVQKSIVLSHAELQGISAEEAEQLIQEVLQQSSSASTAGQSSFVTDEPSTPTDANSTFVSGNSPQSNSGQNTDSQANFSGVYFGPGTGFTDTSLLGQQGSMSVTQKARLDGRWVVVKRLPQAYKYNQTYADLLFKEYFNGRDLEHPHIVNIYGRGEDTEGPFFYMEYVDGQPLSKRIPEGGSRDQRFIRKVAVEILDALSYAHKKQVYHRDLKPDNILITNRGDNVKIIDFGLAAADKFEDPRGATFMGTKKYAAPEQSSALSTVDGRTDLYAFGLIMLELFTGAPDPANIKQLPLGYWRSIISQCLQPNPADRFQNASEILEVINSYHSSASQPPLQNQTTPPPLPNQQPVNRPVNPNPPINKPPVNQPQGTGKQKLPNDVGILVLGILSIVACCFGFVFGIIALVLANQSEIAYNQNPSIYDPGSRQLVKAGKICAIIGLVISALFTMGWFRNIFS